MSQKAIAAKNVIGGVESEGQRAHLLERRDPANGKLVSTFSESTDEDVRAAARAARSAFEESTWARNPKLREETLRRIQALILKDFEELAGLQTRESGKIIRDSQLELRSAADLFGYNAGLARNVSGRTSIPDPNVMSFVMREPIGVVGMIVPWNSPLILLARSLAPALAAGNTVVVKPSAMTPAVLYEFVVRVQKILGEAPKGVINLVLGSGRTVGRQLVVEPEVDMISFTGSTASARQIIADSAEGIKRLSLELGGKSPNIMFADADMEAATMSAIRGQMLGTAGQVCFAGTRVLVQDDAYDKVRSALKTRVPKLVVGEGIQPSTEVGPLVSQQQVGTVLDYIEKAKGDAKLVVGGKRMTGGKFASGNFVEPTLFEDVPLESNLAREEVFGPVISLMRFKDLDEAARIANGTEYGLSAAIWTRDISKAFKLAARIKSGMVWINSFGRYYNEIESGGYKQSGMGRLRGVEGIKAFTQTKTITLDLG